MTELNPRNDLHALAGSYSLLSKNELLIELQRLIEPARFKEEPSDAERKREGEVLWRRIRTKVAVVMCRNRKRGGNKSVNTLITAGSGAFIEGVAKIIIGEGILPDVTAAVAAAVAALLYEEIEKGLDSFCEAYYVEKEVE